jgi:hypothetical protein
MRRARAWAAGRRGPAALILRGPGRLCAVGSGRAMPLPISSPGPRQCASRCCGWEPAPLRVKLVGGSLRHARVCGGACARLMRAKSGAGLTVTPSSGRAGRACPQPSPDGHPKGRSRECPAGWPGSKPGAAVRLVEQCNVRVTRRWTPSARVCRLAALGHAPRFRFLGALLRTACTFPGFPEANLIPMESGACAS